MGNSYNHGNKFEAEVEKLAQALALIDDGDPRQAEAGVRALGELLGFTATRPDNDGDTGPDVLWRDDANPRQFGFELKTDKNDPATYFKKDISQGHDHLEWMAQTYPGHTILGLAFVGPAGKAHAQANPSADMSLCLPSALAALRDELLALIEDLRKHTPMERLIAIAKETEKDRWDIESLLARIDPKPMSK
ncbi:MULTISPECIES: hypothetical protein [unclassified Rhizobium]|uniref:hypothetical protein n=1 Tax=unclassified Rhizobium TaxID=2613769 RepID=UPI001A9A157B|nr:MULTISPECIES: hypothetical protein [unclassified Rhizobium]QSZ24452.1 hypothetical protein J3O30_27275 [Rhizobium sp. NZLR1]